MTIDTKQSFRKGSVIAEVHVGEYICAIEPHTDECIKQLITPLLKDYGSINKAKKANRTTQYRAIPYKARIKSVKGGIVEFTDGLKVKQS